MENPDTRESDQHVLTGAATVEDCEAPPRAWGLRRTFSHASISWAFPVSFGYGKSVYIGDTLLSILISLALYFSGRRETAIFVGLWAPTILDPGQALVDEES